MRTKYIIGYNNDFTYLPNNLQSIIIQFKSFIKFLNIIIRQLSNKIHVVLHIPNYNNSLDFHEFSEHINTLSIHTNPVYNRSSERIHIFGDKTIDFTFPNKDMIFTCTSDSFLQSDLQIAKDMYDYIDSLTIKYQYIYGLGDDTLTITKYLNKPSLCYYHCKMTMDVSMTQINKGTLDWKEFAESQDKQLKCLIITPGRNGLRDLTKLIEELGFTKVIYVRCKDNKDKLNNFVTLSKKSFVMNENEIVVEHWHYKHKISIGEDCSIAWHLNQIHYPFDWCKSKNIENVLELLETKFEPLLEMKEFVFGKTSDNFFHIDCPSDENKMIIGKWKEIQFPHDFKESERNIEEFIERMKRRIDRFMKLDYRIFVRYQSLTLTQKQIDRLLEHCDELIIITRYPGKIKSDKCKVIMDEGGHESWRREKLKIN